MGLFAFLEKGLTFMKGVNENLETLEKTWDYVNHPKRVAEKKEIIKRKLKRLSCQHDDLNEKVLREEHRTGKKRKREVEDWFGNFQRIRNIVCDIDKKNPIGLGLENYLDNIIGELEHLSEKCVFSEDLVLDVTQTRGELMVQRKLILPSSDAGPLKRIWECLTSNEMQRVGIYGIEGVGKTEIMVHIHNKLIENREDHFVHWVAASSGIEIRKLQSDIANVVGVNLLEEEDTRKRASKLRKHWERKKTMLFLDGLFDVFEEVEIGNPSEVGGCKLIIISRSRTLCQKMRCQETIEVKPLTGGEAQILFKTELQSPPDPALEEIAKQIIEKCGGLPGRIFSVAKWLRGVDDIHEWNNKLNELKEMEQSSGCDLA